MTKLAFSEKQMKAAWLKANGRTDAAIIKAIGLASSTYYKWKKTDSFTEMVEFISSQTMEKNITLQPKGVEVVDLDTARSDELSTIKNQRRIALELGELTVDLLVEIRRQGVTDLGIRHLPSTVRAFTEAVSALQNTNDRLIGLDSLISDLIYVERTIKEKLIKED